MGTFIRVCIYLSRKKGRTMVLFLLLLALMILAFALQIMKRSTDQEGRSLQESMGSSFILKADMNNQSLYEPRTGNGYSYQAYVGPRVTEDMIDEICAMDGVTGSFVQIARTQWTNLKLYPAGWAYSLTIPTNDDILTEEYIKLRTSVTSVFACREGNLHPYFRNGAFEVIEGRNIEENDSYKAVISEGMAERNGIGLHDTFRIELREGMGGPTDEYNKTVGVPIELEVIGIFQVNFYQEITEYLTSETSVAENYIFTDWNTEMQMRENAGGTGERGQYTEVTFFVESPEILDTIMDRVREEVPVDGLLMEKDDSSYLAEVGPYRQIGTAALILLLLVLGAAAIILYLLYALWVKGRKKEIGILLSLGIKRTEICIQFIVEALLVTAAAFLLSCIIAGPFTGGCAELAEKLTAPEEGAQAYETVDLTAAVYMDIRQVSSEQVEVSVDMQPSDMLFVACLFSVITVGSVSATVIRVVQKDPRTLLDSL